MVAETAITTSEPEDRRKLALLKAVGLDRVQPEQRELALQIAKRYELDLLLKHLVLIEGRAYITRDGLLHIAHRSGQLDGIETTPAELSDGFWRSTCSVYRKDMSRPFSYAGRYPEKGNNAKFGPEMAVKVAEVMALRRAFDVAAPTAEERWDAEVPAEPAAPPPSLAERAAAARAAIATEPAEEAALEPPFEAEEAEEPSMSDDAEAQADAAVSPGPAAAPLSKQVFVAKLSAAGIDSQHATAVRLAMFPDITKDLNDGERGQLWQQLQAELVAAQ